MKPTKAVVTAASPAQRLLPLQTLIDRDGVQKSVLRIILEEAVRAGVEDVCVVVCPGDSEAYKAAAGELPARLTFVDQPAPRGYGHALYCARDFAAGQSILHLVGDHLWLSRSPQACAEQLVEVAAQEACSVSAVQASREGLLPYRRDLYVIEDVLEKPTPTEAEQRLVVPGLRAGHYLCFFGMHVLTPAIFGILERKLAASDRPISLSPALAELAVKERYLALERPWGRYDVGVKYGLLTAQLALALSGAEREQVLTELLELLAQRER
jgi:UTP--glucose-1-phosphate uridylyltransferase